MTRVFSLLVEMTTSTNEFTKCPAGQIAKYKLNNNNKKKIYKSLDHLWIGGRSCKICFFPVLYYRCSSFQLHKVLNTSNI